LKFSDTAACKSSTNYVDDFGGKNLTGCFSDFECKNPYNSRLHRGMR
jgi:hypothetical protein